MDKFRKLGISEEIVRAIEEHKFTEPSEIQEKAIPSVLQGKDIIGGSATGSGKTLVFGSGIIQNTTPGKGVQALILEPTRELAEQVSRALKHFSKYKPLKIVSIYGGVAINPQYGDLETADIVIGTPGRILDHLARDTLKADYIKILVLDEADRMLDMGFIDDVEKIIRGIPRKRQTLLFSATIDGNISYLARKYLINPIEISAESYVDASKLKQVYYEVESHLKFSLLVHLLKQEKAGLVMVFCNTRKNADFVSKNLKFAGIEALSIHGGFSQEKRTRTIETFSSKRAVILVCTDIAARGLDIKSVSHVYNYDIPKDDKDYIHRIGRTARAGKEGKAVSLLTQRDFENFRRVLKNPDLEITSEPPPKIERVRIQWFDEAKEKGFGKGFSKSGFHGHKRDSGRSRDHRGDNREEREFSGSEHRSRVPRHTGFRRH
ncbi:MAG: DEAD/DEAH box helicase [Nanoarchaeota archaeon]|nr:DEAD/DEAH box helicase [Nanoarchaeota archaeon]MBU4086018.1 DEAD/DEAH box helicase [Nanoarchaeota archaeon]